MLNIFENQFFNLRSIELVFIFNSLKIFNLFNTFGFPKGMLNIFEY